MSRGASSVQPPESSTSRDQPEEPRGSLVRQRLPFLFTVRFGITAWYTGMLILTIALLGLGLRATLVQSLNTDAESRLMNGAQEVKSQIDEEQAKRSASGTSGPVDLRIQQINVKSLDLAGISVNVVDARTGKSVFDHGPLAPVWPDDEHLQAILEERTPTYSIIREDTYSIRGLSLPIVSQDPNGSGPVVVGMIFTSESMESTNALLKQLNQSFTLAGLAGALIATLGGWSLAGWALAPVNRIMKSADDLAHDRSIGALSRRLEVPQAGDELTLLGMTFNRMLDRIERSFQSQRQFVADASHELRTPLTSIKGNVDVIRRQLGTGRPMDPADIVDALDDVSRETARMSRLVDDLLALARNETEAATAPLHRQTIDLDAIAHDVIRTAESLTNGQMLVLDSPRPVTVFGDGDKLTQVMLILMDNALRYTPEGGSVTLRLSQRHDPQDDLDCACIEVVDTGTGIDAKHLPHLFERFYRAEGSRSRSSGGTGLGLSIALSIVRWHGGWIDVESHVGKGTRFSVWIPRTAPDAKARSISA